LDTGGKTAISAYSNGKFKKIHNYSPKRIAMNANVNAGKRCPLNTKNITPIQTAMA
jgi:hypothetical protein